MLFEQITPFMRFTAEQNMSNCEFNNSKPIVGYDHRIYFVLKGSGGLKVGNKNFTLQPDTFVMWRAGIPYRYYSEKDNPMVCITCNFDFTAAANDKTVPIAPSPLNKFDKSKLIEEQISFSDYPPFNETVFLPVASNIRVLMVKLAETYLKKLKFYSLHCNNILQEILIKTAYQIDDMHRRNNETITDIINYVQEHFRENLSNEEIGAHFGYHPNYINALLIKHTKTSLHKYILKYKLSYAVQQLLSSNKSVNEISDEINIQDTSYFSRLFKKYYHKTPSEFRLNK